MKLTQFNEDAKLTELSMSSNKVFFTEYESRAGFEADLQEECQKNRMTFIRIIADSLFEVLDISNFGSKILIFIDGLDELDDKRQSDVFSKIKDQAKKSDIGIIIPVRDITKISQELLRKSVFVGNSENLPPVNFENDLKALISSSPNVALTEIRRKYTSTGSENKSTPK